MIDSPIDTNKENQRRILDATVKSFASKGDHNAKGDPQA
jgi:hypothetical protein